MKRGNSSCHREKHKYIYLKKKEKKSLGARSWLIYCDMNLVTNLVAGDAELEILVLYFLSLYCNDLLSLYKQIDARHPDVWDRTECSACRQISPV